MKRSAVCLLSLSILLCAKSAVAAPPSQPSPQVLFREGKYAEAQRAYEAVISGKRNAEIKEQRAYAELLLGYGRALSAQRKYNEAYKMLSQASAIAEAFAMPGEFSRLLKTELEELRPKVPRNILEQNNASFYYHQPNSHDQHDVAEQEYLAKASIEFAKQRYGSASMVYLLRHIDYAKFLCAQHRPDDLVKEAQVCREVFSKLPPDFQAETARQILQLAETLASNRLPVEADTVGSIVLVNIGNGSLKSAPQYAEELERLAQNLESAQATDSAQKYYLASVRAFEQQLSPDDPRLAKMRDALAAFYKKHNKNGAAIELLEMSVAAQEKNIALGSAEAIKALGDLTELYCVTGNLPKAKECATRLSEALRDSMSEMDITTAPLMNAAELLAGKDDFDGAMNMFKAALKASFVSRHHRSDYELQKEVRQLAVRLGAHGKPEQAEQIYDAYIASRATALGQPSPQTLSATLDKATFFLEQEVYDKAAAAAMQAVELSNKFPTNQDYRLNDLAQQLYQHKQYEPALKLTEAWLASLDGTRNSQTYQIVEAKLRVAGIYKAQGNSAESIKILQAASKTSLDKLGTAAPQVKEILERIVAKLVAEEKVQVLSEILTSVAQLSSYQNPIDGMIRVVYPLSNEHMTDESIAFLEALIDANAKTHGPSSLQASTAMSELARIYLQNNQAEKGTELQKSVNAIHTLQRKQQQTNPRGTDVYNPRAPLAETLKAAQALGSTSSNVGPGESFSSIRSVHIRNIGH